jgi:CheY-like chemotaxis protein
VLELGAVVAEVQKMMARLIGEDIDVTFQTAPSPAYICADPGQIQQIVLNLAVNARDAMPDGGRLTIAIDHAAVAGAAGPSPGPVPPGDYVVLTISDTGVGMDAVTLSQIFEPFFTTKQVGHGTGLGLATVYGIVQQSHALITVSSEPGGTSFTIYFPRVAADESVRSAVVAAVEAAAGQEALLLVEDEDDLRELLQSYLESLGYAVISAPNGRECLAVCQGLTQLPRLLVTDVVMPGMSGRALADQLRQTDPTVQVLYLSGYTDDAVLRHGILPSGTHFLQKPFALHDLAAKVREILDRAQVPQPAADLS